MSEQTSQAYIVEQDHPFCRNTFHYGTFDSYDMAQKFVDQKIALEIEKNTKFGSPETPRSSFAIHSLSKEHNV
jgi:hypothetical protein